MKLSELKIGDIVWRAGISPRKLKVIDVVNASTVTEDEYEGWDFIMVDDKIHQPYCIFQNAPAEKDLYFNKEEAINSFVVKDIIQ